MVKKHPPDNTASSPPLDIPALGTARPVGRDITRVRCSFWTNATTSSLSLEGKALALYLLTAPNPNVTPEDTAQLLHISHRKAKHAFAELEEAGLAYRRGKETVVLTGLLEFAERKGNGFRNKDAPNRAKNWSDSGAPRTPDSFRRSLNSSTQAF